MAKCHRCPSFSHMANMSAPFTGAISHSGVLGRFAPARWNVVRLVGVTDANFLFYKVWFTQPQFMSCNKGQHLQPMVKETLAPGLGQVSQSSTAKV